MRKKITQRTPRFIAETGPNPTTILNGPLLQTLDPPPPFPPGGWALSAGSRMKDWPRPSEFARGRYRSNWPQAVSAAGPRSSDKFVFFAAEKLTFYLCWIEGEVHMVQTFFRQQICSKSVQTCFVSRGPEMSFAGTIFKVGLPTPLRWAACRTHPCMKRAPKNKS